MAQPNKVYDPESDEGQYSPKRVDLGPGHSDPRGKSSYDPNLHDLKKSEEKGGGFYDANGDQDEGDNKSSKSASPSRLNGAEQSAGDGNDNGLYNAKDTPPKERFAQARQSFLSLGSRAKKSKWLIGLGFGGLGLVALVIALILIAGAYKVVDFAEHVAAYQFARTTSQMAEDTLNITEEETALSSLPDDSTGNSIFNSLKEKYGAASSDASALWAKLDDYRPGQVIKNFEGNNVMSFNQSTTKLGRSYTSSVTINNTEGKIINSETNLNNSFAANHIPGFKFNSDFQFSRDFAPDLVQTLKANDIGPITRARVAASIRQELGVSLQAWLTGRFAGKSGAAADAEAERESTAAAQGEQLDFFDSGTPTTMPDTAKGASSGIDGAASDVLTAEDTALANDKQAQDIANNSNETPASVSTALDKDVSSTAVSGLGGIIGVITRLLDPVYKYAVPLCLIYDGSMTSSGPTIDEQSQQEERTGIWIQAAAAQEKDGSNANGEAVGATDWKLGDTTQSVAEERASGIPVNTSDTLSTESSPTGQYTYTVADYLPGIGSVVDDLSPTICSALTNVWVGVGVGAVNIGLLVFSGGSATAGEAGGEAAVEGGLESQLSLFDASSYDAATASDSSSLLSRAIGKAQASGSFAKDFAKDVAKNVVTIGALTLLAKQLVVAEMGGSHSTLATGKPYDDGGDSGTNIYANEINQKQFYGAPMTDADLGSDNAANQAALALKESQQSTFERYAAINNPDSLVSHMAIITSGFMNGSFFTSLTHLGAILLNPFHAFSALFDSVDYKIADAATPITSANTYYGNVQFGYTQAEKALLDSCPQDTHDPKLCSYGVLENQNILDESGNEAAIASKYSDCFTKTVGQLESSGEIQRDVNGDVIANAGLCSPDNLSFNSPDPLAVDTDSSSPKSRDMIFRYRVAEGYNNTLDQLSCEQTVSADSTCDSPPDSTSTSTPTTTTASAPATCPASGYFSVCGSRINDPSGNEFTPYGISVIDDLDQPDWQNPAYQAASDAQIQAAANYWHVNSIRLQVSEANIVGNTAAMARLGAEVDEIESLKKIPIINDNLEQTDTTQAGPTSRTIAFWQQVTSYLASQSSTKYTNVIFDIYNENKLDWAGWQKGGSGYVGMQDVVNAIRSGSNLNNNLIMIEGPNQASSLADLDQYPITGSNLAFAYHHVDFTQPSATWENTIGLNLSTKVPIIDGEWAQYASTRTYECYPQAPQYVANYLSVLQSNNIGLIFWSLEPGVGTATYKTPQPVSDGITANFPTTASDYSQPNYFQGSYACADGPGGNLVGQGAGAEVMSYFEKYGSN
jgi:hypothetical protein